MHLWRVAYREGPGREQKYFQVSAVTDREAIGVFMEHMEKNHTLYRLPVIGEHEGQPVVGFVVSVLSDGKWTDPGVVGL